MVTETGSLFVQLPIDTPPSLKRIGSAFHGTAPHNLVETYRMKDVYCLHLYTYHGRLIVNGTSYGIVPGSVSLTPPWADMIFRFEGKSYHISAFFSFPRITGESVQVPVFQHSCPNFEDLIRSMEEAKNFFPLSPKRAGVRIWDILWSIADSGSVSSSVTSSIPKHIRECVIYIENNLRRKMTATEIADQAGVTPTHLARLFQQSYSLTVMGYIRWRRALRAREFLIHTMHPIKSIAAEVGLPDLQHFYKTIRKEFGITPGMIRRGHDCGGDNFSTNPETSHSLRVPVSG